MSKSDDERAAQAAANALLKACGRSDLGRRFLRQVDARTREDIHAAASEHRERGGR